MATVFTTFSQILNQLKLTNSLHFSHLSPAFPGDAQLNVKCTEHDLENSLHL